MRRVVTRGALIVVGGHSRGVGKTTLIEHLLRTRRDGRWVAIKISAHRHAAANARVPLIEEAGERSPLDFARGRPLTQTGRYLAAGARRAFLVRAPDAAMCRAAAFIRSLRRRGWNVIVESNRIVRYLTPDALLFVVDPRIEDWKPSSSLCLSFAGVVVCARPLEAPPWRADDGLHPDSSQVLFRPDGAVP